MGQGGQQQGRSAGAKQRVGVLLGGKCIASGITKIRLGMTSEPKVAPKIITTMDIMDGSNAAVSARACRRIGEELHAGIMVGHNA